MTQQKRTVIVLAGPHKAALRLNGLRTASTTEAFDGPTSWAEVVQ